MLADPGSKTYWKNIAWGGSNTRLWYGGTYKTITEGKRSQERHGMKVWKKPSTEVLEEAAGTGPCYMDQTISKCTSYYGAVEEGSSRRNFQ